MRASKSIAAEEVATIKDLTRDLERRLHRLSGKAQRDASGASHEVVDFVSESLERLTGHIRESAVGANKSVADEVKRIGSTVFRKLAGEIENRPALLLAVAAGVGFLAGLTNRR